MTIKQLGGVFGRNPTFNNVTIEGTLTFDGDIDINSDLTIEDNLYVLGSVGIGTTTPSGTLHISSSAPAFYMTDTTNNTEGVISMDNAGSLILNADLNNEATSSNIRFAVDGTERMRIDATGTVTANPTGGVVTLGSNGFITSKQSLDLATAGGRFVGESNRGVLGWLRIEQTTTGADGGYMMLATSASGSTSPTERLRIDSLGNLLVGVTSTTLTGGSLTLPNSGIVAFHDAGGAARNVLQFVSGNIKHGAAGGGVTTQSFYTNNTLAATIDSSQNLLLGKTIADNTTQGIRMLGSAGFASFVRDQAEPIVVNRLTDDGDLIEFRQDGAPVGSVGVASSRVYIGTDDTGLRFTNDEITPFNPSVSADRNGTVDLGGESTRFKDLFLSGGVVFGATGGSVSSKTLDDYEEGTWTPTLEGAVSAGSYSVAIEDSSCKYTKVGRQVTVTGRFTFTVSSAGSSYAKIGGLPFATSATNAMAGAVRTKGIGLAAGTVSLCTLNPTSGSVSYFAIGQSIDNANSVLLDIAGISSTDQITVTLTYFV